MSGELSEQPLAELIREISARALSSTLRLRRGPAEAVVYFQDGKLIFAASNLRNLRLCEYLKKRELLSEAQIAALGNTKSDLKLAAELCANGTLPRQTVEGLLTAQVADLLRVCLLWVDGTWQIDERARLADSARVTIDVPGLMLEVSRKMRLKFVASRFQNAEELISPVIGTPDFENLLPMEGFILSRVDQPLSLSELIAVSGQRELDAMRVVYGLALGGFLARSSWPAVLSEDLKPARPRAVPVEQAPSEPAPIEPPQKSEEAELSELFFRLQEAITHYEVLDVGPSEDAARIKNAYYSLARRYHPDRFRVSAHELLHGRIESAFARITQAYETLSDPKLRTAYDAKIAAQEKSRQLAKAAPKSNIPEEIPLPKEGERPATEDDGQGPEESFREGFAALQQGEINVAITHLAAAAHAAPQEPRYRAFYGLALAGLPKTRRLAELEMQAAIKLDPNNSSYRAMLAELYWDLTFYKRARAEAERALALDENNSVARALLRKIEATRKAG